MENFVTSLNESRLLSPPTSHRRSMLLGTDFARSLKSQQTRRRKDLCQISNSPAGATGHPRMHDRFDSRDLHERSRDQKPEKLSQFLFKQSHNKSSSQFTRKESEQGNSTLFTALTEIYGQGRKCFLNHSNHFLNTPKDQIPNLVQDDLLHPLQGVRISSPARSPIESQYLQERPPRVFALAASKNYLYEYLFVQVSPATFMREFHDKIRQVGPANTDLLPISPFCTQTQCPQLFLVREAPTSRAASPQALDLQHAVTQSIKALSNQGLRYKCTVKKQYVHDCLSYQKSLRYFAKRIVLVVGDISLPHKQTPAQASNSLKRWAKGDLAEDEEIQQTFRTRQLVQSSPHRARSKPQVLAISPLVQSPKGQLRQALRINKVLEFVDAYNDHPLQLVFTAYASLYKIVFQPSFQSYALAFRQKQPQLPKIIKQLKLQIAKGTFKPQSLEKLSTLLYLKEKVLICFLKAISEANLVPFEEPARQPRAFVGPGNNATLVKTLIKRRFWWQLTEKEDMRQCALMWTQARHKTHLQGLPLQLQKDHRLYNKIEGNYQLSNKKHLFLNLRAYYQLLGQDYSKVVPMTFHIRHGVDDPEFFRFRQVQQLRPEQIWIVKPGENTNRGNGISVSRDPKELQALVCEACCPKGHTCILQRYISDPLLINGRKFDIRTFALLTSVNGRLKGFFYAEGYLRTSSKEYNTNDLQNRIIHLTNDAVQCQQNDYGKYEPGNKLSYAEFQTYLDQRFFGVSFERDILGQLKQITKDCFRAVWGKIDRKRRMHQFELFGFDFMLDQTFHPYLIECNTNPCLETPSPLQSKLIPQLLENTLRVAVDPYFPPPEGFSSRKSMASEIATENKYQLLFDEEFEGSQLESLFKSRGPVHDQDSDSEQLD